MIYIDEHMHCHTENPDGVYIPIETEFFNGKCKEFIEGFCVEMNNDGTIRQIYSWKDYSELDAAQREYERQLLIEQEATIAELDSLVLSLQYNSLIGEL